MCVFSEKSDVRKFRNDKRKLTKECLMAAVQADVDGVREGNGREILEVQRLEKNCTPEVYHYPTLSCRDAGLPLEWRVDSS